MKIALIVIAVIATLIGLVSYILAGAPDEDGWDGRDE